jgi:hypothetical protein
MTDRDFIDKLTTGQDEETSQSSARNFMGIPEVRAMAVSARFTSSKQAEDEEALLIESYKSGGIELPITWWDSETGAPEPLRERDYALLDAAGIDPTDWEIDVIEEQLNRSTT